MTLLCGLVVLACAGVVSDGAQQYATIGIVRDFVQEYPSAGTENSDSASASLRENIGGVTRSAIYLHPGPLGEAKVTYRGVAIPAGATPSFLFFCTGIREGVPWNVPAPPNGVRFTVYINGGRVFSEELMASVWHPHALDLSVWSGKSVDIVLATDAIKGRSNHDWSVWGNPMLVTLTPVASALTEHTTGIAFAQVVLPEPDTVTLTMGEKRESFALPGGSHWLPLEFGRLKRFEFVSASGGGEVKTVWIGARDASAPGKQGLP
jgi:hypothetical protein